MTFKFDFTIILTGYKTKDHFEQLNIRVQKYIKLLHTLFFFGLTEIHDTLPVQTVISMMP